MENTSMDPTSLTSDKLQGIVLLTEDSTLDLSDTTSLIVNTTGAGINQTWYSDTLDGYQNTVIPPKPNVRPLEWSEPRKRGSKGSYSYVIAESPFGAFRISWKGNEDNPKYNLDIAAWHCEYLVNDHWVDGYNLEEVKQLVEEEYQRRVQACLENVN
jgi:hypothetical protein